MATDTQYETFSADVGELTPRRRGCSTCLIGCLVTSIVALVVIAAAVYWISENWRDWVSSAASQAIKSGIDASELPAEEKEQIKAQVDRVSGAFREGELSNEQLGSIMKQLVESPLLTMAVVAALEKMYFDDSGLSDEEKVEGSRTLRRFTRGVVDEKIDEKSVEAVLEPISDRDPDSRLTLREEVTDEELRAFLEAARLKADEAGIPEEPEVVDPSDEFKRIIDEAMGEVEAGDAG